MGTFHIIYCLTLTVDGIHLGPFQRVKTMRFHKFGIKGFKNDFYMYNRNKNYKGPSYFAYSLHYSNCFVKFPAVQTGSAESYYFKNPK